VAITNYSELVAAVGAWLHRSDLTTSIPDFIRLAEDRLNGDVVARGQETRSTLVCVPGGTVAARYVALPSDFSNMRRLTLMTEPSADLEYRTPDQMVAESAYLLSAGVPVKYTIIGSNIELAPPPDSAYNLEIVYRANIPSLNGSNTTNWLLTASPSIYLYASLIASVAFTQDTENIALWEGEYKRALDALNNADWYTGTTMRVKSR